MESVPCCSAASPATLTRVQIHLRLSSEFRCLTFRSQTSLHSDRRVRSVSRISGSGGNNNGIGGIWDLMKMVNFACSVIGCGAAVVSAVADHRMLKETQSMNEYTKEINKPKTDAAGIEVAGKKAFKGSEQ